MTAFTTHYDNLRVARSAPDVVIHAAYRALAQKYHPDKNIGNAEAVQMMTIINVSYKTLSDPQKRLEHDQWIRQQEPPPREMTPAEKEVQAKIDKASEDAVAWTALAAKATQETKSAKEKAEEAAKKAATASASEKAQWTGWAEQTAAALITAQKKEEKAHMDAMEARTKADTLMRQLRGGILTHYDTLKLARNAPMEVIRAVHKEFVQKYHPDKNPGNSEAAHMMQIMSEAYTVLSNPDKRAEYDQWIQKQLQEQQKKAPAGGSAGVSPAARAASVNEKEAEEFSKKANALAAAAAEWAVQAVAKAKAAEEKADKAAKDAEAKAKDKDAAQWAAWAKKLATDAAFERKAADAAENAAIAERAKAAKLAAVLAEEKERSAMAAQAAKAAADKEKAMWESVEKKEK